MIAPLIDPGDLLDAGGCRSLWFAFPGSDYRRCDAALSRVFMGGADVAFAWLEFASKWLDWKEFRRDVACIFMANHVSNLDPPVLLPLIPGRTSVFLKRS
jgi:1-acyl-sn-glycerol-3-phosphate acyltransferase